MFTRLAWASLLTILSSGCSNLNSVNLEPSLSGSETSAPTCVVLLHGLARTATSMKPLESFLSGHGYRVINIDYHSRTGTIEAMAPLVIGKALHHCKDATQVHFVTHSLGGILVRYFLSQHDIPNLGHVVMLGPPNKGSQVVDKLRQLPGYRLINGPAGLQLGTDPDSVPLSLGPANFSLGIIAGTRSFNPILSLFLPNPDDGKVSVENTKVAGMSDMITVPHTHTFMMRSASVARQVLNFLRFGQFNSDPR